MCVVSMNGVGRLLQYCVLHIVTTVRPADNLITDMCIEKNHELIIYLIIGESHETLGKMVLMCGELLFFTTVETEMHLFYKCKYFILVTLFSPSVPVAV